MKILGTGLTGLVGSRIVELLSDQYQFENLSRSSGVNIVDKNQVETAIAKSDASMVLHLAAKTDVDGCEKDKDLVENGEAWKINVEGTNNVAQACLKHDKKIIFVSTDFVFDGTLPEGEFYSEDDAPNPINWYAKTKYEGEKIVQNLKSPWLIVRLAYPYRESFTKGDFFRAIKNRLENGQPVDAVEDHIFCPTFIDDFAIALECLIDFAEEGIFHSAGGSALSPYDAAIAIAGLFGYESSLITKTTRVEFFKNRAERPFNLALKNDKINKLGIHMRTFEEGVEAIKRQLVHG